MADVNPSARWELYKKYGSYYPTAQDIIDLSKQHPGFNLSDLTINQIRWKKDGCGFTMLQIVY